MRVYHKTLVLCSLIYGCKITQVTPPATVYPDVETVDSTLQASQEVIEIEEPIKIDSISLIKKLKDTISFAAVGDIMMGTNFPNESYLPPNNGSFLWLQVQPYLQQPDITFGNLEGVILTEGGDQKTCNNPKVCFLFRTPDSLAFHFKDNGFDLLSLANNHANDFGKPGRLNTQRVLDSLGIQYAGSAEKHYTILERDDYTVGFIAVAPNSGTLNLHQQDYVRSLVMHLDTLTDIVVVSFHAGAEGAQNQRVTRKREFYFGEDRGNVYQFSHDMIDAGADILLGHGPHVVRAFELYKNKLIAYSLGNFLTYGRFNLTGENALAPLLLFDVDRQGNFISGQIQSFIQTYENGPIVDQKLRAIKKIKELSEIDFPESELYIEDSGKIIYLHR